MALIPPTTPCPLRDPEPDHDIVKIAIARARRVMPHMTNNDAAVLERDVRQEIEKERIADDLRRKLVVMLEEGERARRKREGRQWLEKWKCDEAPEEVKCRRRIRRVWSCILDFLQRAARGELDESVESTAAALRHEKLVKEKKIREDVEKVSLLQPGLSSQTTCGFCPETSVDAD